MKDDYGIIGLTVEQAEEKTGRRIRPLIVDGNIMMGTMDFDPERINVSITDGVIDGITGTG